MAQRLPHSIALLGLLMAAAPALAGGGDAGRAAPAAADNRAECAQKDRAYDAFQACSRLLMLPDISTAEKIRIAERRAQASLVIFYFNEAAEDFTTVLQAEPDNLEALKGRGEALSEAGEYKKAAEDWTKVAAKLPDDIASRIHLGKNLYAAGMFDKSAAAYEDAVKLDANNAIAYIGLARAYDGLDVRDKADAAIESALKLNPANSAALLAKGEMAERRGNTQIAIESYSLSLKANGMQVQPRKALQRLGIETPP